MRGTLCMINLLTINDVIDALGISRTTFWRLRQDKAFPRPVFVSPRCPRWIEHELLHFVQNNKLNA
ncbi:helix-turn-helix transcriptional regulator [Vibrio lamellibrachiae]|uniref:helix-turn-helix transcriptional regulator n=1 Tax=Vibrio lamellibrachiae TaxID=2910253 RepID=UPI003D0FFA1E